jgi:hypothetical protein
LKAKTVRALATGGTLPSPDSVLSNGQKTGRVWTPEQRQAQADRMRQNIHRPTAEPELDKVAEA